ncbi:MAG TPA: hypothetical protein PKA19_13850, partial [Bacillota bacterium]|nr:hypothetical protein [Bacillota bacterium]
YSEENYIYSHKIFGKMLMDFDRMAVRPLDFTTRFEAMKDSINADYYPDAEATVKLLDQAVAAGEKLNQKIASMNSDYAAALKSGNSSKIESIGTEAKELNLKLAAINKKTTLDFTKLDNDISIVFPAEVPTANLTALADAISGLEKGNAGPALDDDLWAVDDNYGAYNFDRATCQYFIDQLMKQPADRLAWGANMVYGNLDLFDVIQSLKAKNDTGATDFSAEIATLKSGMDYEQTKLNEIAAKQSDDLQQFISSINSIL